MAHAPSQAVNVILTPEAYPAGAVLNPSPGGIYSLRLVAGPVPGAWHEWFSLIDAATGRAVIAFHPGVGQHPTGIELVSPPIAYGGLTVGHLPKGASLALAY